MELITIITATLNAKSQLVRTYESILQSTYIPIEWIVIDGGSTDGTIGFLNKNRLCTWISEKDDGIYDAWNKGLDLAHGEWIIFLGAGDLLNKNWLTEAIKAYKFEGKPYNIIYSNQYFIGNGDVILGKRKAFSWKKTSSNLKKYMCLPHAGLLHHRSIFIHTRFNKHFNIVSDWLFFIKNPSLEGLFLRKSIMANVLIGGISSSLKSMDMHYSEYRILVDLEFAEKSFIQTIKWKIKIILIKNPFLYNLAKKLWLKIQ